MAVLTFLAVSAVMAVSVMTATPLKLNPFSVILKKGGGQNALCDFWGWGAMIIEFWRPQT